MGMQIGSVLTPHWTRVAGVASRGPQKLLRCADGRRITVHRFACVGEGDDVRATPDGRVWVRTGGGEVPVTPTYHRSRRLDLVPGRQIPIVVHEITTASDLNAFHSLSEFHYRNDESFGRRAVLLMSSTLPSFPRYLGFIEITTPFLNLRNRNQLFNAPFRESGRDISWTSWDLPTRNKLINIIARISRVVIHPEVRGLRISSELVAAAAEFSATRWQIKGLRPLFLEITADMLRFMPFVESAGMAYIGESPGNLDRIVRDQSYLTKVVATQALTGSTATGLLTHSVISGAGKGILSRQRRDAALLASLRDKHAPALDIETFLRKMLSDGEVDAEAWEMLLPLIRTPKPTYMLGLTPDAQAFVRRRIRDLDVTHVKPPPPDACPASGPIRIRNLTIGFEVDTGALGRSDVSQVRQAFGMSRKFRFKTGVTDLSFDASPGEVCFVFGASGSGKTSLISSIANRGVHNGPGIRTGVVQVPSDAQIGGLESGFPPGQLISTIGAASIDEAIFALNSAGLSEPRLYLSQFEQLSAGQRYRAYLARLICSDANVWLLDEFATGLDEGTATAVARSFARVARAKGVIAILASVRRDIVVNALAPDLIVHLSQLEAPQVITSWEKWMGLCE